MILVLQHKDRECLARMTSIPPSRTPWNFQASWLVPQASVLACDVTSHLVASLVSNLCFAGPGLPFLSAPPACVQSNVRMLFVNKLLPCHSSQVDSSFSSLPCAIILTPQPFSLRILLPPCLCWCPLQNALCACLGDDVT